MAVLSFQRKVLILGVCIAVLAATYILGTVFSPARIGQREAETAMISEFNRQREAVAEIRIQSDRGNLKLVKREESWTLPGGERDFPASGSRIAAFLDFLQSLARTRVVTDNPDSWQDFEVQAAASRRIQLLDSSGEELTEIIVGKPAAGGGDDYVRLGDSNEVVLSNRSFDYYLNVEEKFWAYLRIFPEDLDGQGIMRISVESSLRFDQGGDEQLGYTLVLSSEQPAVWKLVDLPEGALDNQAVDQLAGSLADLEGTGFAHGVSSAEAGLTDPSARILISTADDRDFRLFIGNKVGDDQYYVKLENGDFIYKVSEWRIKGVIKKIAELREQS